MDFEKYVSDHEKWSRETFGDGCRVDGILKHIITEVDEVKSALATFKPPAGTLYEWVDLIILAIDGAINSGYSADEICDALVEKQAINKARKWPEVISGIPTEHIKGE